MKRTKVDHPSYMLGSYKIEYTYAGWIASAPHKSKFGKEIWLKIHDGVCKTKEQAEQKILDL